MHSSTSQAGEARGTPCLAALCKFLLSLVGLFFNSEPPPAFLFCEIKAIKHLRPNIK